MSHSHHDHGHPAAQHHEPASSGSPNETLAAVVQAVVENATALLTTAASPVVEANHDHHAHHAHGHASDTQAAAPEGHDHSGHSMRMWFHGGYKEVILFDCWRINSVPGLIFSFLLIFVMATLYEGLKWFRVNLQTWADQANRERAIPLKKVNGKDAEDALIQKEASSNGHLSSDQVYSPTVESSDRTVRSYRSMLSLFNSSNPSPFSPFRLLQTGIYCVQLTLAYWLMLVAMTYNTYLTAAVVLGAGFGHWLFAILKRVPSTADRVDAFASDACH